MRPEALRVEKNALKGFTAFQSGHEGVGKDACGDDKAFCCHLKERCFQLTGLSLLHGQEPQPALKELGALDIATEAEHGYKPVVLRVQA